MRQVFKIIFKVRIRRHFESWRSFTLADPPLLVVLTATNYDLFYEFIVSESELCSIYYPFQTSRAHSYEMKVWRDEHPNYSRMDLHFTQMKDLESRTAVIHPPMSRRRWDIPDLETRTENPPIPICDWYMSHHI